MTQMIKKKVLTSDISIFNIFSKYFFPEDLEIFLVFVLNSIEIEFHVYNAVKASWKFVVRAALEFEVTSSLLFIWYMNDANS